MKHPVFINYFLNRVVVFYLFLGSTINTYYYSIRIAAIIIISGTECCCCCSFWFFFNRHNFPELIQVRLRRFSGYFTSHMLFWT